MGESGRVTNKPMADRVNSYRDHLRKMEGQDVFYITNGHPSEKCSNFMRHIFEIIVSFSFNITYPQGCVDMAQ